jgi:pimeloyl-ACP methyl ester carboxylesterase
VYGRFGKRDPLLALSGGPGQAGVLLLEDFASSLAPALHGRALVVVDQRGTGNSGLLRCRELEHANLLKAGKEAGQCARKLGRKRLFYTSDDTVADLDALRRALGAKRWSIYGVSYGTKVAQMYAARHPAQVGKLILDSVVEYAGPDPLYARTFEGVPRILRQICAGGACRGLTTDLVADVGKLVALLARKPIHGRVYSRDGRGRKRSVGRNHLFATLLSGDFDPTLRAELPAAVRSALRGDGAPLLRLAKRAEDVESGDLDPSFLSPTLYATTVCEEGVFPWDWAADTATRMRQASDYIRGLPAEAFHPFDHATVLSSDEILLCARWPTRTRALQPLPPLPDVPTLMLTGEDDLRTSVESARGAALAQPGTVFVTVPNAGHSVLGVDLTNCTGKALSAFMRGRRVTTRCPRKGRLRPSRPIPGSLSEVGAAAAAGKRGRTVSAVALTLWDVLEQSSDSLLFDPLGLIRGGGLRGGRYFETRTAIQLAGVTFVPGVHVSGLLREGGVANVRVSGRSAADGRLRFGHGRVTGMLDGRRVSGRIKSLARPALAARISRVR